MSSPPPGFRDSSPAGAPGRSSSQFTYRHLAQLASYTASCPLRVVAHIDLDAFYAQCEMRRLGLPDDQPLAVQQWQGLIAVNYPARDRGIGRFHDIHEARKLCDTLICQHVATWREGEDSWAYRDDPLVNTDKVSLDPYRLQSRKILATIKDSLPASLQKVEKASIDEVFLDLSAHVHSIMLARFTELARPPPYDDPSEKLPMPSISALDWKADALVDLDDAETETDDPDWDDVAISIGSEIVRDVRAAVRNTLKFTCSAGIAQNKMLAKLGSGAKKPNGQTVIRNRAITRFLSGFKVTKIRNLGGKLGDQVVQLFGADTTKELLLVPPEQFQSKLGDDTGLWVYQTIRGIDHSEVNSRVQIKSMLSAKSFRPSINSTEQAHKWLRIFVGDIYSRLVEEGVLENKRRPRTINLHHRHGGQTKSRQSPIPQGRPIDQALLLDLATNLMGQIVLEGQVWPCANLSLSVGGFDEGVTGNMGISAFLVHGAEAQALKRSSRQVTAGPSPAQPPGKQNRLDRRGAIQHFFSTHTQRPQDGPTTSHHANSTTTSTTPTTTTTTSRDAEGGGDKSHYTGVLFSDRNAAAPAHAPMQEETRPSAPYDGHAQPPPDAPTEGGMRPSSPYGDHAQPPDAPTEEGMRPSPPYGDHAQQQPPPPPPDADLYTCERCKTAFDRAEDLQCHQDEHFARDIQAEEERGSRAFAAGRGRGASAASSSSAPLSANTTARSTSAAAAAPRRPINNNKIKQKMEAGQSKLKFG